MVPEVVVLTAPVVVGLAVFWYVLARKAARLGYPGLRAYLRAAPRSDAEKRDAADLALKGGVCCLLALLYPPLVLVGMVPLFYGGRKLVYASMGLRPTEDVDRGA